MTDPTVIDDFYSSPEIDFTPDRQQLTLGRGDHGGVVLVGEHVEEPARHVVHAVALAGVGAWDSMMRSARRWWP
jgi:hypothetical protein